MLVPSADDEFWCDLSVAESDDALLKMSVPNTVSSTPSLPDFSRMTEDEQIAYALQMSMQAEGAGQKRKKNFSEFHSFSQKMNNLKYKVEFSRHRINSIKSGSWHVVVDAQLCIHVSYSKPHFCSIYLAELGAEDMDTGDMDTDSSKAKVSSSLSYIPFVSSSRSQCAW